MSLECVNMTTIDIPTMALKRHCEKYTMYAYSRVKKYGQGDKTPYIYYKSAIIRKFRIKFLFHFIFFQMIFIFKF